MSRLLTRKYLAESYHIVKYQSWRNGIVITAAAFVPCNRRNKQSKAKEKWRKAAAKKIEAGESENDNGAAAAKRIVAWHQRSIESGNSIMCGGASA